MVEAKTYLDHYYPKPIRRMIWELNLSNKDLEGSLDLTDFTSLRKLDFSYNPKLDAVWLSEDSLKTIEEYNISASSAKGEWLLTDFSKIKKFDCSNNKITKIDASKASGLTYLNVSSNLLSELELPTDSRKLEILDCSKNPDLTTLVFNPSLNPKFFSCLDLVFDERPLLASNSTLAIGLAVPLVISILGWLVLGWFFCYNKYKRKKRVKSQNSWDQSEEVLLTDFS